MTPSDNLEINRDYMPPSVSSASSLDSMPRAGLGDGTSGVGSQNDTRQHTVGSDSAGRGDVPPNARPDGTINSNASTSRPSQNQGIISPAVASSSVPSLSFPSMMLPSSHLGVPVLPSGTPLTMPGTAGNNSIPEFLYQLTKMLTDNNRHIIEWTNGKIEVHSPHRLEAEVLHRYFRHSKFASFQRQLNYFGFRKNAGKGKMAPCSYVNEATTNDLSSVLLIKRKNSATQASSAKDKEKKKEPATNDTNFPQRRIASEDTGRVKNPMLAARANAAPAPVPRAPTHVPSAGDSSYKAVAKSAVGRGIRHNFTSRTLPPVASTLAAVALPDETISEQATQRISSQDSLSQLATNYRNSLIDHHDHSQVDNNISEEQFQFDDADPTPLSQMHGDAALDPLLELAMIPEVDEGGYDGATTGFNFVDFPNPEVRPRNSDWDDNV